MEENNQNSKDIKKFARKEGADLVGIADLKLLKGIRAFPDDLLDGFRFGISIAVSLPDKVIDGIGVENPTALYAHYYKAINSFLDFIALKITKLIQREGYTALPIPASLIVGSLFGNISHKAVARSAGLGEIGRNLLLLAPNYGPRIRLATVLTDMPLKANEPINTICTKCNECIKACPIEALREADFEGFPQNREEVLNVERCWDRLGEMERMVGASVCGMCIKACPVGRKG
jgi:epoxyqueuosine reductase QueG